MNLWHFCLTPHHPHSPYLGLSRPLPFLPPKSYELIENEDDDKPTSGLVPVRSRTPYAVDRGHVHGHHSHGPCRRNWFLVLALVQERHHFCRRNGFY